MCSQGILEFSNQSYRIPRIAGLLKNFDVFNKFQRKDAFLEKKIHKSPKTNLEYILLHFVLGELQKKGENSIKMTDPRCLEHLQIKSLS